MLSSWANRPKGSVATRTFSLLYAFLASAESGSHTRAARSLQDCYAVKCRRHPSTSGVYGASLNLFARDNRWRGIAVCAPAPRLCFVPLLPASPSHRHSLLRAWHLSGGSTIPATTSTPASTATTTATTTRRAGSITRRTWSTTSRERIGTATLSLHCGEYLSLCRSFELTTR